MMWGRGALLRGCISSSSRGALRSRFLLSRASTTSFSPLPPSSPPSSAGVAAQGGVLVADSPPPPKVAFVPTLLQPRVVVYDGVCHLCHKSFLILGSNFYALGPKPLSCSFQTARGVKWVIKADKYKKIKFCCLQSKAADPYLKFCGVDREDVLRRFVFVEGPDSYYEASTAALKVASYLPLPYSAAASGLLLIVPAPLRDAVYDYVAKRRYDWFGKERECIVVITGDAEMMLERFIDRDELMLERRRRGDDY